LSTIGIINILRKVLHKVISHHFVCTFIQQGDWFKSQIANNIRLRQRRYVNSNISSLHITTTQINNHKYAYNEFYLCEEWISITHFE